MLAEQGVAIQIDNRLYRAAAGMLTGAQLRSVVNAGFDLYRQVPAGDDVLIRDEATYAIEDGMHFFTVPSFWS
jgi:hypothetical protein